MNGYYNLTANEIDKLSETAQDFFQQSIVSMKMKNQQTLSMLGCSKIPCKKKKKHCNLWYISNIFLQKNFFPGNHSTIQDYKKLTNEAMETLLVEFRPKTKWKNNKRIHETTPN